jgi:hypothetical protein
MALSLDYETRHGITASYWRIEKIEIRPAEKRIKIGIFGHLDWKQAGGPNNDSSRTRSEEPAQPLVRMQISAHGATYDQYVKNHTAESQTAAAYDLVKHVGVPDGQASQIDFSNATDV